MYTLSYSKKSLKKEKEEKKRKKREKKEKKGRKEGKREKKGKKKKRKRRENPNTYRRAKSGTRSEAGGAKPRRSRGCSGTCVAERAGFCLRFCAVLDFEKKFFDYGRNIMFSVVKFEI